MIMIIMQILIVLIVKNCFQLQSPSTLLEYIWWLTIKRTVKDSVAKENLCFYTNY